MGIASDKEMSDGASADGFFKSSCLVQNKTNWSSQTCLVILKLLS